MMFVKVSFAFLVLLPTLTSADYLTVSNAWVREAPPMSQVMVAYAKVKNTSAGPVWITGAQSESFDDVEMHESVEQDGVASMQYLPFVKLEAGQTAEFKPGGKHLMLFRPVKGLRSGDKVDFQLRLGNGDREGFTATVKRR